MHFRLEFRASRILLRDSLTHVSSNCEPDEDLDLYTFDEARKQPQHHSKKKSLKPLSNPLHNQIYLTAADSVNSSSPTQLIMLPKIMALFESSDDEGPPPAIIDSGPEDAESEDDDDSDDNPVVNTNHYLGSDGYYHPVKEIKGSYLKKDKDGKMRLVKRVRWMDTNCWADSVDCPYLPFQGYVNHRRKNVVDLTVEPQKVNSRKKNPAKNCQFCGQPFSRASYCSEHELKRCRATGSLNHTCGASCTADGEEKCPGRITMDQYDSKDRRDNNPGCPSQQ